MMRDPRDVAVLAERARKLASRGAEVSSRTLRERVVLVSAGRETYGLPVSRLREIVHATPVVPLPGLPASLPGIAAVRGELLSVVDLAELEGRGTTGVAALYAVLEVGTRAVAMRIESVVGFRDVFDDEVAEGLTKEEGERTFARFVTSDLVPVLDVERLLSSDRLVVGGDGPIGGATGGRP